MKRATLWIAAALVLAGCQQSGSGTGSASSASKAAAGGATPAASSAIAGSVTGGEGASAEKTMPDGLKITDLKVGDGAIAEGGMVATLHYTGWLTDGTKFDSSLDSGRPLSFTIGEQPRHIIEGWDEGVRGMRVGGKRRLVIPPALGYGATGTPGGPIPPNATLVFELELLNVK
jgi:FKBP-type peptidyl-prolyl cis-trans isomerase